MKFEEYATKILQATDGSYVGLELDMRFDVATFLEEKLLEMQTTQVKLAQKLKMKPSQLNRILKAERNLTLETIARIYHAFSCRPKIIERYAFQRTAGLDCTSYRQNAISYKQNVALFNID